MLGIVFFKDTNKIHSVVDEIEYIKGTVVKGKELELIINKSVLSVIVVEEGDIDGLELETNGDLPEGLTDYSAQFIQLTDEDIKQQNDQRIADMEFIITELLKGGELNA